MSECKYWKMPCSWILDSVSELRAHELLLAAKLDSASELLAFGGSLVTCQADLTSKSWWVGEPD